MIDYRNILRMHSEGHSQRAMERELYCSRHTISDVLDKAKKEGISWPVPSPKKQTKNAGKKPNEKNDKYNTKLLYSTAFIPRFA